MGRRILKCLGYGLKWDKKELSCIYNKVWDCYDEDYKFRYDRWVKKHKKDIYKFYLENYPYNPRNNKKDIELEWKLYFMELKTYIKEKTALNIKDSVIYDSEYGIKDLMLFIPPGLSNRWKRYDDLIDYYESNYCDCEPQVKILNTCGVYPHTGMVRIKLPKKGIYTKDTTDKNEFKYMTTSFWSKLSSDEAKKALPDLHKHIIEDYRPVIPLEICCLFYLFKDIFSNPSLAYNSLRPMIYTFWS